ncbi:MAG TPA: FixH family protein [Hyphomicrobiaceae bacterium]|nr:FixH family protein [Hyphomicrobiaceae bacterium]
MRPRQHGETATGERVITGRHVLWGVIAFFGVIFAVNGVFLYEALSTYTGVVSREPYRKGLHYNERIAAEKEQQTRGWASDVALTSTGDGLAIILKDHQGNPVGGLTFEGRLGRPATEAMDVVLDFKETAPGSYLAAFATLAPGTWQVDLTAKELTSAGEKVVWRARKRVRWKTSTAAQ